MSGAGPWFSTVKLFCYVTKRHGLIVLNRRRRRKKTELLKINVSKKKKKKMN